MPRIAPTPNPTSTPRALMQPHADVSFRISGNAVPLDHGYSLFSALSRAIPALHQNTGFGIHPIFGERAKPGVLKLLPTSCLTVRLPASEIGTVLPLVGQSLNVGGNAIVLGAMTVRPLRGAATLKSRFVTIKGFGEAPEEFAGATLRQIQNLGVSAELTLGPRRVLRIAEHRIVGFAVGLGGLSADDSLVVQIRGIGGRRHHGAGVFTPVGSRG